MRRLALLALALACAACTTTQRPAAHTTPARHATTPVAPARLAVHPMPWRLPGPLAREAVVPLGGRRVLVAGGLLPGDTSAAASYILDLASGRVVPGRPMPVPVHDTAGALVHGKAMVLGGGNAAEQAVVQARSGPGWRVVGRLPTARSDLATVDVGGRVLAIGGYDGSSPALGAVLASSDGRHWSRLGRLPVPVRYPGVTVADGAVWVIGGERSGAEVTAVQRLDPATGRARVVAHLPHPLGHETAALLGGRILVAGGRTGPDTLTARMWWFDPHTLRFTHAGRLPHPLADSAVVQGHDVAWLVGGETPAFSRQVLELTDGHPVSDR